MMPRTPIQATLWRCWRKLRIPLLIQQSFCLGIGVPLLAVLDLDPETVGDFSSRVIISSVFLLWATSLDAFDSSTARSQNLAPHNAFDFVKPISSRAMVLYPMLFRSSVLLAAYLVPTLTLRWLFGSDGPYWFIAVLILEGVVIITTLSGWTQDSWSRYLTLLILWIIAWQGWLIPEFETNPTSGMLYLAAPMEMLPPVLVIVGGLGLLVLGVGRQRHGDELLPLQTWLSGSNENAVQETMTLGFLKPPCPTGSAARAEYWLESRFRGLGNYLWYGLLLELCLLLTAGLLKDQFNGRETLDLDTLVAISLSFYGMMFFALFAGTLGANFHNDRAELSTFVRARPMSTARFVAIKLSLAMAGSLFAAIGMYLGFNLFGWIFLENAAALNQEFLAALRSMIVGQNPGQLIASLLLVTGFMFTGIACYASMITWLCIKSNRMVVLLVGFPAYILVAFIAFLLSYEEAQALEMFGNFMRQHLWLLVILVPLFTVYLLYYSQRFSILTGKLVAVLGILGFGLALLFVWRAGVMSPDETALEIGLGWMTGLLPLFAAGLVLWTLHRARHQ